MSLQLLFLRCKVDIFCPSRCLSNLSHAQWREALKSTSLKNITEYDWREGEEVTSEKARLIDGIQEGFY